MTKLYELTQAYQALLDTEELTEEELDSALDSITDLISNKALNVARLILTLQGESITIDNEIKRLNSRKVARENKIKSLKSYLLLNMETTSITKAKDNFVSVTLQPSPPSVVILDVLQIPDSYWRIIPEQKEVDKRGILTTFKEQGKTVPGTEVISTRKHIVIR